MPQVHWIDVEIPTEPLCADHCDKTLIVPSPLPEGTDVTLPVENRAIVSIIVPTGSPPGCTLSVAVGENGENVNFKLPPTAISGDEVYLIQRVDMSWHAAKRTTEYSYLLPECSPGDELTAVLPDSQQMRFAVPPGQKAGDVLNFTLVDGVWAIKSASILPEAVRTPSTIESVHGPLADALNVIRDRGLLAKLPVDSSGILHISLPFCGGLSEYALLGNFIADNCLTVPGIQGARILATVCDRYSFNWLWLAGGSGRSIRG